MNPILHQAKWDFRRIRTFWILWMVLLVLTTLFRHLGLTRPFSDVPVLMLSTLAEVIVVHLLGALLAAFTVFTTPFSGSTAFWKTRPITQRSLFRLKTLFILAFIWVPATASRGIQYLLIDPDPSILTGVAFTYAPLLLGLYLLAATWTATCSNVRSLTLCLAGTVGFAMLVGMLAAFVHRGSSRALVEFGSGDVNATWSTLTTALILMASLLVIAWLYGARLGRPTAAVIIAGSAILILVSQNTIWTIQQGEILIPHRELALEVVDRDQLPAPSQSLICPQLAAELPGNQLLLTETLDSRFVRAFDQQQLHEGTMQSASVTPTPLLRGYPPGTRLIDGQDHSHHQSINDIHSSEPGTISGSCSGYLFDYRKIGTIPATTGSSKAIPGYGYIRINQFQPSGLYFELTATSRLDHSRERRTPIGINHREDLLVILRHVDSGTIIQPQEYGNRGSGGFNLTMRSQSYKVSEDAIRAALGHAPDLAETASFELDLYSLTPVAIASGMFRKDNWIPFIDHPHDAREPIRRNDWTHVLLPEHPTDAQVDSYLDTIIHGLPRDISHAEQQMLQSRFNVLRSRHLDRLIMRFPIPHYFRHHAMNTIRRHATREHLPVLLAAFGRDPRLAEIFVQKRWQAEAVSIAREHLRQPGPFYSRTATHLVAIATVDPDPAINDDLFHHFVIAEGGHSIMIKHLRNQPAFPLDDAIAQAWKRERAGLSPDTRDLAYHAIRLGDPEALRQAIAHFTSLTNPDDSNFDGQRTLLDAAIDQPDGTDALTWAHAHFASLQFDPDRKVFHRPP